MCPCTCLPPPLMISALKDVSGVTNLLFWILISENICSYHGTINILIAYILIGNNNNYKIGYLYFTDRIFHLEYIFLPFLGTRNDLTILCNANERDKIT